MQFYRVVRLLVTWQAIRAKEDSDGSKIVVFLLLISSFPVPLMGGLYACVAVAMRRCVGTVFLLLLLLFLPVYVMSKSGVSMLVHMRLRVTRRIRQAMKESECVLWVADV